MYFSPKFRDVQCHSVFSQGISLMSFCSNSLTDCSIQRPCFSDATVSFLIILWSMLTICLCKRNCWINQALITVLFRWVCWGCRWLQVNAWYVDRYLAKSYSDLMQGKQLQGIVSYLANSNGNTKSSISAGLTVESLIDVYTHRAARCAVKFFAHCIVRSIISASYCNGGGYIAVEVVTSVGFIFL